tara:strand:- start:543 stop:743 length:201 start_codon:yes stop_codon:yes gene_type:complete
MIILGIIVLTNSISISNVKCSCDKPTKAKPLTKDIPSKVFDNMFDDPSVWMGYSDLNSNEFKLKKK